MIQILFVFTIIKKMHQNKLRDTVVHLENNEKELPPGMPLLPNVATLINNCKSQRLDHRILIQPNEGKVENRMRMTILLDTTGKLVKWYYG
jgi:hypothetical protein